MGKSDEKLIEKVTAIAVKASMDYIKKEQKERRDWKIRNTKLLLKHYKSLLIHCEDCEGIEELPRNYYAAVEIDFEKEELTLESIKRSKKRTQVMVKFIQKMLEIYKITCEQLGAEEMRKYNTVDLLYIQEDNNTVEEIAEKHNVETRTVYRDINDAAKELSVLMFGVDSIRLIK